MECARCDNLDQRPRGVWGATRQPTVVVASRYGERVAFFLCDFQPLSRKILSPYCLADRPRVHLANISSARVDNDSIYVRPWGRARSRVDLATICRLVLLGVGTSACVVGGEVSP